MGKENIQDALQQLRGRVHPVVPFDPGTDRLRVLDLTAGNTALSDGLLADTGSFSNYINSCLRDAGARYGIGGYGEHRTVYRFSHVFDAPVTGEEPRRLHLGTDIWGKPHTPVMAPLSGMVHSFANNDQRGDYGATIILVHRQEDLQFYTLYGHLSLNSIRNLHAGDRVEAGEVIGEFGIPAENGGWPPHLHFQLITDLEGRKGDYPGVCRYAERASWLANCPDPDLLLQLNQYCS